MGYLVEPHGRLLLPAQQESAAVAAVRAAWSRQDGALDPAEFRPSETLPDIAWLGAAAVERDGDWLVFGPDLEGDPKWSDQVTAFYAALAPYVRSGQVAFEGEDFERWSYEYVGGRIVQDGRNGWDGSAEPFGPATEPEPLQAREPAAPAAVAAAPERPAHQAGRGVLVAVFLVGLLVIIGIGLLVSGTG